jgi:hypothetical protein
MTQNLADQPWFLDACDDAQLAAAIRAALDLDVEYPFQALGPVHGRQWLVVINSMLLVPWHDLVAVLEVHRMRSRLGDYIRVEQREQEAREGICVEFEAPLHQKTAHLNYMQEITQNFYGFLL